MSDSVLRSLLAADDGALLARRSELSDRMAASRAAVGELSAFAESMPDALSEAAKRAVQEDLAAKCRELDRVQSSPVAAEAEVAVYTLVGRSSVAGAGLDWLTAAESDLIALCGSRPAAKLCAKCGEYKPLDQFERIASRSVKDQTACPDGLSKTCKSCIASHKETEVVASGDAARASELKARVSELERALDVEGAARRNLDARLKAAGMDLGQAERELGERDERIASLEEQCAALEREALEAIAEADALKSELAELRARVSTEAPADPETPSEPSPRGRLSHDQRMKVMEDAVFTAKGIARIARDAGCGMGAAQKWATRARAACESVAGVEARRAIIESLARSNGEPEPAPAAKAEAKHTPLSELKGLTPDIVANLEEAGLESVEALAAFTLDELKRAVPLGQAVRANDAMRRNGTPLKGGC